MTSADPSAALVARLRAAGCVFAEDEAALLVAAAGDQPSAGGVASPAGTVDALEALVARRVAGEPLETVLGWVEFAGLRLGVGPGVFVPRRRTELLARTAVRLARESGPTPVVVEACCGVAPVASLVAREVPGAQVHAADLDPVAVGWARRNLAHRGQAWVGDLLDPVPPALRGRVDVLVANAPYVPHDAIATMPPEARDHEPHAALDGGADGVDVQRRLLALAPVWVRAGGHVLVETSVRQTALTRAACPPGWPVEVLRDDDVDGTVVVARRPA
ncbi:putative protein N(5)-glutamine methyltransferase [Cellulomonas xiejunii]|uniref:Release factor glutamine methyltransferase n=1 Tax=Cellulomonas xiejunii TaxID=2968083 RepID=A0ABY5KSJ4_9CELL|nr:putative protein N(5)-glutamine methyltransferase [Cellulomonas xiejunii]MCC2322718.1 putative protein N(5)-glutamine methyltransferase [Cellulomonas xiejunii]UUI72750.1 putative protein N(5)-glutamine methyltransferase [Cellulomonas xiejunii]